MGVTELRKTGESKVSSRTGLHLFSRDIPCPYTNCNELGAMHHHAIFVQPSPILGRVQRTVLYSRIPHAQLIGGLAPPSNTSPEVGLSRAPAGSGREVCKPLTVFSTVSKSRRHTQDKLPGPSGGNFCIHRYYCGASCQHG